jgi:hypothetical protein
MLCVCVCVSLSLSVFQTLSLSLSLSQCVSAAWCSLSVSLFRANMCTADDVQCSSTTATPKMPDCNAHFRSSNPTSQHLVSPGPLSLSLSLSLSFHALFSGHPLSGPRFTDLIISVPRFRTPSLPDLVSRNSFTDLGSVPRFRTTTLSLASFLVSYLFSGPRFRTSFSDLIISPPCFRFTSLPDLVFRHSSFFTDLGSGPRFSTPSLPDLILELFYGPRFRTKTPSRSLVLGPLLRTSFQDLSSSGFSSSFLLFFN